MFPSHLGKSENFAIFEPKYRRTARARWWSSLSQGKYIQNSRSQGKYIRLLNTTWTIFWAQHGSLRLLFWFKTTQTDFKNHSPKSKFMRFYLTNNRVLIGSQNQAKIPGNYLETQKSRFRRCPTSAYTSRQTLKLHTRRDGGHICPDMALEFKLKLLSLRYGAAEIAKLAFFTSLSNRLDLNLLLDSYWNWLLDSKHVKIRFNHTNLT